MQPNQDSLSAAHCSQIRTLCPAGSYVSDSILLLFLSSTLTFFLSSTLTYFLSSTLTLSFILSFYLSFNVVGVVALLGCDIPPALFEALAHRASRENKQETSRALTGSWAPHPLRSRNSRHLQCCPFWCPRGIPAGRHYPRGTGGGAGDGLPDVHEIASNPHTRFSLKLVA